ncbi:MAG: hypothetical protein RMI94_12200 [Bryobacterales bacterium]|nr:hypothetical protein [Bryobacteraceae bacterium]MDW8131307.1 hypothetical protein [Bryobacterales bacterium]
MSRATQSVLCACAAVATLAACRAQTGLPPEWEVRKQIDALTGSLARLKPALDQVRAEEWIARGAPEAYVSQARTLRTELGYLERSAEILRQRPDRLTAVLDTFFRLDRFQALLVSLEEGVRRYQNPALADLLRSVFAEGAPSREDLRQYLLDLAAAKEQELEVADREAQRCRDLLIRQGPARPSRNAGPGTQERP